MRSGDGVLNTSETLTIYLAVGAPFGAAYLFHASSGGKLSALLKAVGVVGGWPLALCYLLLVDRHTSGFFDADERAQNTHEEALRHSRRELEKALRGVEELARLNLSSDVSRNVEAAARAALFAVEKHFHLLVAYDRLIAEQSPQPLALELCRLAGRSDEDLRTAALCIHRRNTARVGARCRQSNDEVIEALLLLRRAVLAPTAPSGERPHDQALLVRATIETYDLAADFLSQSEDASAAAAKATLALNAEREQLRRAEKSNCGSDWRASRPARHNHAQSGDSTLAPLR